MSGQGRSDGNSSSKKSSERIGKLKRERTEEFARLFESESNIPDPRRTTTVFTAPRHRDAEAERRRQDRDRELKRRRCTMGNFLSNEAVPNDTNESATTEIAAITPHQIQTQNVETPFFGDVTLTFDESEDDDESVHQAHAKSPSSNRAPISSPAIEESDHSEEEKSSSDSDSGVESDEEVANVTSVGEEAEDELERQEAARWNDPAYAAIHHVEYLSDDESDEDVDIDDGDRMDCENTEDDNVVISNQLAPEAMQIVADEIRDGATSAATTQWTQDSRRVPRHGEKIKCPDWGHPLFMNRPQMQSSTAGQDVVTYRKVAKSMAAGRMSGEQPTKRDEKRKGYMRRHKLVTTDEPPELVSSDSEDEGKSPRESLYPLEFPDVLGDDEPSWKALTSIAMLSGSNPMAHTQFEAIHHLWEAVTVSQVDGVREVLQDFAEQGVVQSEGNIEEKCKAVEEILRSKIPIFSLSRTRDLKAESMGRYKIPMFRVQCSDPDDPKAEPSLTQGCLYSDLIAADLLNPGVGQRLLKPERCLTPGTLPHYYDTDHGRDTAACHRPGAYGVAADDCDGDAANYKPTSIPRLYTNTLFCQGSTLRVSMKKGLCAVFPRSQSTATSNPRIYSTMKQKQIICVPQGDPFIVRNDLRSSDMGKEEDRHHPEALQKFARSGAVCWQVELSGDPKHEVVQHKFDENGKEVTTKGKDFLALQTEHMNAYLCYNMIIDKDEVDDDDESSSSERRPPNSPEIAAASLHTGALYEKTLIFIRKDQTIVRKKFLDSCVCITHVTVLDTPEGWEKGSLRPVEKKPFPNPYTTPLFDADHDDIPIVTIPIRPFMDDCSISADGKKTAGGLYFDYLSMGQRLRTAIQSIRISGFVTDKTETDSLLLAMAHDLVLLRNQGMIMDTVLGKYRVYVEIPALCGDWVQCAKSTHSTGHASNAPCGGCTWRRGPKGTIRYAEAKGMSSLNYFMNMDRCESVLELGLKPAHLSHLGVRQNAIIDIDAFYAEHCKGVHAFDTARTKKAPLHALRVLRECTPTIVRYDPFLSCWPGPDHMLFLGLGKSNLDLLFSLLPRSERNLLAKYMKDACREAGLVEPFAILRKNQSMKTGYTANLSVAQIAALILVAPVALSQFNDQMYSKMTKESDKSTANMWDLRRARGLLLKLRRMITLIYFAPKTVSDTEDAAKRRKAACSQLGDLCAAYMREVENIGTDPDASSRLRRRVVKFSDLPNLHRFFEVCTSWLPSLGYNIAHLAEIMFEKCHQVIKRYYQHVPSHPKGGYYGMDRIRHDNTLKRVRVASSSTAVPRGSVFDYNTSDELWHLFDKVTPFFSPGHRGHEPPLSSLIDVEKKRSWMRRGKALTNNISSEEVRAMCKEMRLPQDCRLTQLPDTKFGLARESHNIIAPGCVISAVTDSFSKACMETNYPGDKRLQLRSLRLSETLHAQPFGSHQVIVAVHEIWIAERITTESVKSEAIMVKGILLQTDGSISKEDLPIYNSTKRECWVKLDQSCRKVMAFPWKPIQEATNLLDGNLYIGTALLGASFRKFKKQNYFVVVDHENGFPSRSG